MRAQNEILDPHRNTDAEHRKNTGGIQERHPFKVAVPVTLKRGCTPSSVVSSKSVGTNIGKSRVQAHSIP